MKGIPKKWDSTEMLYTVEERVLDWTPPEYGIIGISFRNYRILKLTLGRSLEMRGDSIRMAGAKQFILVKPISDLADDEFIGEVSE